MKITTIKPNFDRSQLKLPSDRPTGVIYLPADFYAFRIAMRRLWMKPKIGFLNLLMDPVGLRPHIVHAIPEHMEMEVGEQAVGQCGVPAEEQIPYACRQAVVALRSKYKHLFWAPDVEIQENKALYKVIFIERGDGETWLYDTYTGKKILVENPYFDPKSGFPGGAQVQTEDKQQL
jgi:hypothetical protein